MRKTTRNLPDREKVLFAAAHLQRIVTDLKNRFDGILTGVRQLMRTTALGTEPVDWRGDRIVVPKIPEMLRIKAVLILRRNAARDDLDFVALADTLGTRATAKAREGFDRRCPQPSGESPLQQLLVQLADPRPFDLEETHFVECRRRVSRWRDGSAVRAACANAAAALFDLAAPTGSRSPASRSSRPRSRRGG